jgi:lipid-A-disaccharide synthase
MISAGEPSGDMHAAALVREAAARRPDLAFFGLGGDLMAAAGVELLAHLRETALMGFTELLGSLRRVLKLRSRLAALAAAEKPAALVLIDSPDFNFALAKAAKRAGVPVVWYICPQVWAWRRGRLKLLRDFVDRRAVIFPFEADFFRRAGLPADLVGHPLLDELRLPPKPKAEILQDLELPPESRVVAVLPGSRRAMAKRLAGPMFGAIDLLLDRFPDLTPAVPRAQSLSPDDLRPLIEAAPERVRRRLKIYDGRSAEILASAEAALLASGTSTVEATLLGAPMVAAYRTSALSWLAARLLVRTPFVTAANLVAGRAIVPELLQSQATAGNLAAALAPLLAGGDRRAQTLKDLAETAARLGGPGAAARTLAVLTQAMEAGRARV